MQMDSIRTQLFALFPGFLRKAGRMGKRLLRGFRALCGGGTQDEEPVRLAHSLVEEGLFDQAVAHCAAHLLAGQRPAEAGGVTPESLADDVEKWRALIETHEVLAEGAINCRGDIDVALDLYRRRRRLQQRFAETFGLTALPVRYLPEDWVRNIGHMALLDFWVKGKQLGWQAWERLVLLAPAARTANKAYLRYWEPHLTIVSDPVLIRGLTPFARVRGDRVAGLLELPDGGEAYFGEGMGVIQEEWERQERPPLLSLTPEDRQRGEDALRRLGVPAGAWFVSLHVRSPGFHKEGAELHQAHRNAAVRSYLPAIREIIRRGGWVIRVGDETMEPMPVMTGLIDYARGSLRSPWMDIYLCAACRFFIGVASGLSHVPATFGVPCVLTNWLWNPLPVASSRNVFIPKLISSVAEDRFLRFEEALQPDVRRLGYCGLHLLQRNLRLMENSPEEIVELVEEMFDILAGSTSYSDADERRQLRFRRLAADCGLIGFARIGRGFLRRHAHLLPPEQKAGSLATTRGSQE
jgi:putative glycosyltransferase (TIGR04372 family)